MPLSWRRLVIGASIQMDRVSAWGQEYLNIPVRFSKLAVVMAALAASSPFWIGMIRVARYLGFELADRVFPTAQKGALDLAVAPRRLLVVTLQLAIVVVVGFPLVAITQPFLPPLRGAAVLLAAGELAGDFVLARGEQLPRPHQSRRASDRRGPGQANSRSERRPKPLNRSRTSTASSWASARRFPSRCRPIAAPWERRSPRSTCAASPARRSWRSDAKATRCSSHQVTSDY